ncbi:hypothetical protein WJX72_007095 [[Myrmecia] bisecta]|uniref:Nucleotide-diphospho-sugar transferase domain-containing protein n=1 Tax=[Myrmecia] bisecta TaxID=41462 RepID=A0AAW1P4K9_9CHLO
MPACIRVDAKRSEASFYKRKATIRHGSRPLQQQSPAANPCFQLSKQLSPAQRKGSTDMRADCERFCQQQHPQHAFAECVRVCSQTEGEGRGFNPGWVQEMHQDMLFVVWYAVGDEGASLGIFREHQFQTPDMSFARALQKSHPGAGFVMMTDQDTQFDFGDLQVDVFRQTVNKTLFGRNVWANFYQFHAQLGLLRQLQAEGAQKHIVFLDMDVLVLDSFAEVFCRSFDYGLTMVDSIDQPFNMGVQFVHKDHFPQAMQFIEDVLGKYWFDDHYLFTEGQIALARHMNSTMDLLHESKMAIHERVMQHNDDCRRLNDRYTVCFFPCLRYNYWDKCLEHHHPQPLNPWDPQDFSHKGVKALHFLSYRKGAMPDILEAFLKFGREEAYAVFSAIPHNEDMFKEWRLQRETRGWDPPRPGLGTI